MLRRLGVYSERLFWFVDLIRRHLFCLLPRLVLLVFVPDLHLPPVLFPILFRSAGISSRPALGGSIRPLLLLVGWLIQEGDCFGKSA